jgi:hypothetical protein
MDPILLTSLDAVYIIIVYWFFAFYIGKMIDHVFVKIYGTDYESKSNLKLIIECAVQVGITASLAYPFRKLINKIKFPLNGYNGYEHINVKTIYEDFTIIWSAFILFFEPTLGAKINTIKKNMTNFNFHKK